MKIQYSGTYIESSTSVNARVNEVEECPICKKGIKPVLLSAKISGDSNDNFFFDAHLLCKACNNSFLSHYSVSRVSNTNTFVGENPIYSAPNFFIEEKFKSSICSLSPQFVKIYNQALSAESLNLDEIAGLGFRKSLEFLVKDFAISENQTDEEKIKKMNLSQCINQYINDPHIKVLTERSAWIGNDEAHYVRKQTDRDVSDMKNFIEATVYFISMVLITKDASSIDPK